MKKILKIIASLISLVIIGIVVFFMFFAGSMCQNQIHKEYLSPNKFLKAVIFQRDCGASTSFSTQISILDANEELDNANGNIFATKGHPDDVAPILNWKNNDQLNIQHSLDGNEYTAKKSFGLFDSIKITYKVDINLDDFLSPTSNQVFKYKMSMQNSNQFSGTTNMDDKYIEKVGNKIENYCLNIKSYLLFDNNDLNQMPKDMQEMVKNNNFRTEYISEQLCSTNGILILNEMAIYKNSNNWNNELQIEEFDINNIQKTTTVLSSCNLVEISEKLLFDKKRKVIHSQCNWKYDGDTYKFEYFIAEGLGLYKSVQSISSHEETESKSIMTVALDEIASLAKPKQKD